MSRQNKPTPNKENVSPKTLKEMLKERLLDLKDMTELFRVCDNTIYNWVNKGFFSVITFAGRTYYDGYEIRDLLEKYKQKRVPGEKRGRKKKEK